MLGFQKLDVYQRSIEFLAFARRLLQRIPKGHSDLVDQLRRSAQSIPQNIAEGAGETEGPVLRDRKGLGDSPPHISTS
jgi:hypothetical protein